MVELSSYDPCILENPIRVEVEFIIVINVGDGWFPKSIILHADCKAMYVFQALAATFERIFQEYEDGQYQGRTVETSL